MGKTDEGQCYGGNERKNWLCLSPDFPGLIFGGMGSAKTPRPILQSCGNERFSLSLPAPPTPFSSVSLLFIWLGGNVLFEENGLHLKKFGKPPRRPKVLYFLEVGSRSSEMVAELLRVTALRGR